MRLYTKEHILSESDTKGKPSKLFNEVEELNEKLMSNIDKEISIPNEVLNSFVMNANLEEQIWGDEKLNPEVSKKLTQIANDYFETLKLPSKVKIKDIIFTGSLANFNWSKFSDVDLHLVIDTTLIEGTKDFVQEFFWSQKTIWNDEHDIKIFDYPVELYVQDVKDKLTATSVYSVKFDKWILKPKKENFKINKKVIKKKSQEFIDKVKAIKKDFESGNHQAVITKVTKLKDKIVSYRGTGLDKNGEFSNENIVFKVLRRILFLDILDDYKTKSYNTMMSVNESTLTYEEKRELINEANIKFAKKRDYYTTLFKVAKIKELYGNDPYWENVQDGQWVGASIVNIYGIISKISTYTAPAHQVRANDLGMRGENPHYLEFKIMAGRGIEHNHQDPNTQPARTRHGAGSDENEGTFSFDLPSGVSLENGETSIRFGLPKPGSPASDAAIKTYLIYGDIILDFVKNNLKDKLGYVDGKGADISKNAMADNPALQKKKIKKDLEMELGRRITDIDVDKFIETGEKPKPKEKLITMEPDKISDFEQRQADAIARRDKAKLRQRQ